MYEFWNDAGKRDLVISFWSHLFALGIAQFEFGSYENYNLDILCISSYVDRLILFQELQHQKFGELELRSEQHVTS